MIGLALTKDSSRSSTSSTKKKKRKAERDHPQKRKRNKIESDPSTNVQMTDADMRRKKNLLFRRDVECIQSIDDMPMPTKDQGDAFLLGITGRRKSGKTFLLDRMMKTIWKGLFDKIYVLSLTAERQTKYFGTWAGNIVYIKEWDDSFFDKVVKELENNPGQKHLIVIDDMSSDMRKRIYTANVDKFSFIGRHWGASVVWLAQKITLFTTGFRQEADGFILFREENMQELRLLHREWGFGDMDHFICQLLENTLEKYSWVMLRNIGGTIHIMRPPDEAEQANFVEMKDKPQP
jgi:hypothetical protein